MKKVLSILLAALLIVSTVAITGIVSSVAADTNPSDDAYVYYTDATDARKSGFAYDFEDFTIDPAKLSDYTAELWIYIGRVSEDVEPQYDFLISLYTEGHYDATVGNNYTEKWAIRKEWKTGNLVEGWNKVELALSNFTLGSTGNDAYNKPAFAAFQSSGKLIAMTLHENSTAGTAVYGSVNIGVSSFTITDGTNTYNVIDPNKTKSSSQIANCLTTNTRSGAVKAVPVSQLPVPVVEDPSEIVEERITLIDPAASKSVSDMYQIAVDGVEGFSVVNNATLTGGTSGVPSSTSYYVNQTSASAKTGGMIKVGGEDGVNISHIYDDFMAGELYVNAWVWVDDPSTDNIIFRMFNRYDCTGFTNYIEGALNNNGVGKLTKGWNYISANITAVVKGSANAVHGQSFQQFAVENVIDYIAFYYHNNCTSDIAVAAVELSTVKGVSNWDVNIEGKKMVYRNGEQPTASDFVVTDKGVVVDPSKYTVSNYDVTIPGRQYVTVTYNSNEYVYEIYNKTTLGQATYHTTYNGESTVISGNRNADNAVIGQSSVQHTAANTAVSYHVATEPLNLYGEEYLEMYLYLQKDVISAMTADANTDVVRLLVEITSNMGTDGRNGVRILLYDTFFINQGCKAGWNKIYIPLNPGTVGNSADSPQVGGVATNWSHDSQTSNAGAMFMDYERVTDFRIRFDKFAGSVALINAVGYGMDVSVDGEFAGNDLNQAIKSAKTGSTVKLNWNNSASDTVVVDKDITLDLNGRDIVSDSDKAFTLDGANVNVVDTNTRYNFSVSGASVYPANKGTVVIGDNAVVFSGNGTANISGEWSQNLTDGSVTISGNAYFPFNDSFENGIAEMQTINTNNSDKILYKGNWQNIKNIKGPVNNDAMRSTDEGDSYKFVFEGSAFSIDGYTSPTYGMVDVYVDGEKLTTLDLYSAEPRYQQHIIGAILENKYHEVEIVALGEKNENSTQPTLFHNAVDTISIVGEFKNVFDGAFDVINSEIDKNVAYYTIENAFVAGSEKTGLVASAQKGKVDVIGNVIKYYAGGQTDVITYYMNGIKGEINITVKNGTRIEAENFCITKDRDGLLTNNIELYSWYCSGAKSLYLKGSHYVEFTFDGTGFDVIAYKSANYGRMVIYVDGKEIALVSLKSDTVDVDYQQTIYSVSNLANGKHTIQLVALNKANVDAIVFR